MALFEFRLSRLARPLLSCPRRSLAQARRPSLIIISTSPIRGSQHGAHEYVARNHVAHRHYAWRNGHRYAYGYNPGAAVAAGVIGGVAAGYPYSCDDSYYGSYGACDTGDYAWGGDYGPYYGGYGYTPVSRSP